MKDAEKQAFYAKLILLIENNPTELGVEEALAFTKEYFPQMYVSGRQKLIKELYLLIEFELSKKKEEKN